MIPFSILCSINIQIYDAGAGHCPMDQVPDLVNSELLRFLNSYGNKMATL